MKMLSLGACLFSLIAVAMCLERGGCGNQYQCGTGECVPMGRLCDGIADCPRGEDELRCRPVHGYEAAPPGPPGSYPRYNPLMVEGNPVGYIHEIFMQPQAQAYVPNPSKFEVSPLVFGDPRGLLQSSSIQVPAYQTAPTPKMVNSYPPLTPTDLKIFAEYGPMFFSRAENMGSTDPKGDMAAATQLPPYPEDVGLQKSEIHPEESQKNRFFAEEGAKANFERVGAENREMLISLPTPSVSTVASVEPMASSMQDLQGYPDSMDENYKREQPMDESWDSSSSSSQQREKRSLSRRSANRREVETTTAANPNTFPQVGGVTCEYRIFGLCTIVDDEGIIRMVNHKMAKRSVKSKRHQVKKDDKSNNEGVQRVEEPKKELFLRCQSDVRKERSSIKSSTTTTPEPESEESEASSSSSSSSSTSSSMESGESESFEFTSSEE